MFGKQLPAGSRPIDANLCIFTSSGGPCFTIKKGNKKQKLVALLPPTNSCGHKRGFEQPTVSFLRGKMENRHVKGTEEVH